MQLSAFGLARGPSWEQTTQNIQTSLFHYVTDGPGPRECSSGLGCYMFTKKAFQSQYATLHPLRWFSNTEQMKIEGVLFLPFSTKKTPNHYIRSGELI